MQIVRPNEVPPDCQLVCRQGIVITLVGSMVLFVALVGSGFLWWHLGAPSFVWVGCMLVAVLSAPVILGMIGPLFRTSNWVLALDGNSVWINLRSCLNTALPEAATAVCLKCEEIGSVSLYRESYTTPGSAESGSTSSKDTYLQFKTGLEQTSDLTEVLKQERERRGAPRKFLGFVTLTTRPQPSAVSVPEPGVIRVLWRRRGQGIYVTPSPQVVIDLLSERLRVEQTVVDQHRDRHALEGAELDELVQKLALSGDTISAAKFLSRRTGISLMAAVNEIEKLRS